MLQCRLRPDYRIRSLFTPPQQERAAVPGKPRHFDVRDSFVRVGWNLSRSRADNRLAIALEHAVSLAHQAHQRVGICVQSILAQQNAGPCPVTKQIEGNASFFYLRCDTRYLHGADSRR